MRAKLLLIIFLIFTTSILLAQSKKSSLLTVAENSNYESTSRYADVINFINSLKKLSKNVRIETLGVSSEGRDIPLMIIGNPLPQSPGNPKNNKRIIVYIQGNIHAGEVEGKEAALMFARDLLLDKKEILKDIVLLISPIFNIDGNEKISVDNRRHQSGPKNGVGLRYNGQNLDLNRDAMKVETPEVKGLFTNVLNKWDPAILVDLHTTNGSYRQEPVSFTWMMNPAGDTSLIAYTRDKLMPAISKTLSGKYNTMNLYYGEFVDQRDPSKGWISYAYEPRYIVNYVGLRNRIGILNENYVYSEYKDRVIGTYNFLWSVIENAISNKNEIKKVIQEADDKTVARGNNPSLKDSLAIESKVVPTKVPITVNTYELETRKDANGRERLLPTDVKKVVTVPYLVDYLPTKQVKLPYAYLLKVKDPKVVNLLKTHGIKIEKLSSDPELEVQSFKIKELKPEQRLNQGHYNNIVKGEFAVEKKKFDKGTILVRMAQPLANVAAYLLEPETDDGLLHWNFFDNYLVPQWGGGFLPYPVYKVMEKIEINSEKF
ncbi:MAG: M14 family metallopeptidase [Melioribacteraceae bacterium]|nr:M14 family metallopeptidase [Melioribacteraceae bacterium]